jgi:hypothetical protein
MPQMNNLNDLISDIPVVTANDIISKRNQAIQHRMYEVDDRMLEITKELEALKLERAELIMEHDMWARFDERNMVRTVYSTTTTVEVSGRMSATERLNFDDTLRAVMRDAGRPLEFSHIRTRMESSGFKWNNYASAHNHIVRSGLLENAGKRGFYQLMKP